MIKAAIKYPVTVVVGVLIAVMGGFLALNKVPIQLTPEVQRPIVTVSTTWFGASPQEIEKEIIEQQEEYLKSVEGLIEMTSESQYGSGTITLEFPVGTDITGAIVKVTNKLNEVPTYPDNADRPVVSSSSPFDNAIAWFVIKTDSAAVYPPYMQTMVEDLVKPRLERVSGVASINLFGGLEEELHVDFNPEQLASSGITVNELTAALRSDNLDISAGDFGEGKRRYVVRTMSRYATVGDVERTVIAVRKGVPIRVGDVATVELTYQKPIALVRHEGEPALAFNAQRQVGANVLEVTRGLLAQMDVINREILNPRGLRMENVYREEIYINSAIDLVFNNLYLGSFLAIVVLFLFLRSASSILVIGLSIPISVITTFLTMYIFGRTINVISLAGMAFAVGMVVDSSIVVLENIYRHLQMGKPRFQAAREGATEVWGALLASTVTTIAVFLPIFFVQARAGQLFKDIAIAISSAIAISLVVSITVIPSLSSRILKTSSKLHAEGEKSFLERLSRRIANWVDYINVKTSRRLATICILVFGSMSLTWVLLPDSEYLPNGNQNFIFAFMLPPPGYNIDEMLKAGYNIEEQIRPLWETPADSARDLPGAGVDNFFYVAFPGQAFMGVRARDESRIRELIPVTNQALFSIPGVFGFANQASLFERGFAGTRSVRVDITGHELTKILTLATQVFGQMGTVLPGSNSRPIPGLDLGNPEIRVFPDRVRAADVGMSSTDIGNAVNALVDGAKVSNYWHEGREIDLLIKGGDQWSRHTQSIELLPLATPSGKVITVGDVAAVKQYQGPVQINHVERQRTVSIETVLPDNIALEDAIDRIQNQVVAPLRAQGQVGGLYDINMSGAADDLSDLKTEMQLDFNVAVILTSFRENTGVWTGSGSKL